MAPRAEVAERQTRYVQGVVSLRAWGFKSPLRHQQQTTGLTAHRALVAQWIERCPAEAEVVSSSLTERAISLFEFKFAKLIVPMWLGLSISSATNVTKSMLAILAAIPTCDSMSTTED